MSGEQQSKDGFEHLGGKRTPSAPLVNQFPPPGRVTQDLEYTRSADKKERQSYDERHPKHYRYIEKTKYKQPNTLVA